MEKLYGKWLVAVSAGPDSMALLHMCLSDGVQCAAAHVNYHHRPEAEEEETYLRSYCQENGVELFVRNEPFLYEGNFEAAARSWRYDFFVSVVQKHDFAGVLVAHQEDDLLETYLMQEEKNITPAWYGLKEEIVYHGIRVKRPLLKYTKAQLQDYCDQHGIRYYIDATNASDEYTRNRIRHQYVEPMTRYERDSFLKEIRMKNAVLQERNCRIDSYVQHGEVSLKQYRKMAEDDRKALLRKMISEVKKPVSSAFVNEIDQVLLKKNDFCIDLGEKNLVQNQGILSVGDKYEAYEMVFETAEDVLHCPGNACFRIAEGSPGINAVSVSSQDFPLKIRSFREGDAIEMRFGTKSVHRFFVDRHIPRSLRKTWPVVENADGAIILVPGLGCDRWHFSIKPDFNVIQYPS